MVSKVGPIIKTTINNAIVNFTAAFVLSVVCLLAVWHVATGVDKKGDGAPLDLC